MYTNYVFTTSLAATFNAVSLGDISDKGVKIRLKEKHVDFAGTQANAGLAKRTTILESIEAEFEIDDCDVNSIKRAFGYGLLVSGVSLSLEIGQQIKHVAYPLVLTTQDADGTARTITIDLMIPTADTVEFLYNRKTGSKVPLKFTSYGAASLVIA